MSGQEQQQGQGNAGTDMAWMIAGFFAVLLAIWFGFKEQILHALLLLKFAEASLLNWLHFNVNEALAWLQINLLAPAQLSFRELNIVMGMIGSYYRWPVAAILICLSTYLFVFHPSGQFKKSFSMKALREQEKVNWPQITPVIQLDLAKTDLDEGPWAMVLSPMDFCIKYGIIIPPKRDPRKPREDLVATIDEEKCKQIMLRQMGEKFQDPDALPIHLKALIGCFAARALEERVLPAKLMKQIAASADDIENLNFSGAQELFDKYKNEKLIQKVFSNHAYTYSMMATMLEVARLDGVFASADFLWLKPLDRSMWYMLNNVGRQTAFTEVAGPFAHWRAEKKLGRRLNTPMVEEAVHAFRDAIAQIIYTGDKEKWDILD